MTTALICLALWLGPNVAFVAWRLYVTRKTSAGPSSHVIYVASEVIAPMIVSKRLAGI
jgi:hypothetical protein